MLTQGRQHLEHGTTSRLRLKEGRTQVFPGFLAGHSQPKRGVRSVPVPGVIRTEHVGQGTAVFQGGEGPQDKSGFLHLSGGQKPSADNERVSAPVQEPGVARDDGQSIVAAREEGLQGPAETSWDIQNSC